RSNHTAPSRPKQPAASPTTSRTSNHPITQHFLSRCNASGRYWFDNRPDVVDWDCRLRSGRYYLYLLIDTGLLARA
ncbi:hypothetical protein ABT092_30765, partial [Streptomyces sp. NPDC002490]